MAKFVTFGRKILLVVLVNRGQNRHLIHDFEVEATQIEGFGLFGIVGQQANAIQPQILENLDAHAIVPHVGLEAQGMSEADILKTLQRSDLTELAYKRVFRRTPEQHKAQFEYESALFRGERPTREPVPDEAAIPPMAKPKAPEIPKAEVEGIPAREANDETAKLDSPTHSVGWNRALRLTERGPPATATGRTPHLESQWTRCPGSGAQDSNPLPDAGGAP